MAIKPTLLNFDFLSDLVNLDMSCISTVATQILINGECAPGFSPTRGISQGDPLSP